MKIPLRMNQDGHQSTKAAQTKVLERDILAAQKGDWNAKKNLVRTFTPLITSLAEKRTSNIPQMNEYIESGRNGLYLAAKKYKPSVGANRFRIFALDFIEKSMDRGAKGGGFFSRLLGGKS